MTTLEHRPHTALVVIDVQNDVVAGAHERDAVVGPIRGLVGRAREEQVPLLVSDAHTTEDQSQWGAPPPSAVIAHSNLSWTCETAPGRTAGTVPAEQVSFR